MLSARSGRRSASARARAIPWRARRTGEERVVSAVNGDERQYWGVLPPMPADMLSAMGQQAEARGLYGLFAVQVHGAPWPVLAAASVGTQRLQFASGVAIAAARSPFETAMTAIDLDRITGGRFILGLGASVHSWTCGFHGVPKRKPLTDLKETVRAVRYIVANAHKGLEPFEGEYYRADFAEFQPTAPPVREQIPIWTAAMRGPAVRAAGEVSDGVMGHPMWSLDWAEQLTKTELLRGLEASKRSLKDIHINLWVWAAPHDDPQQGIADARATIAFYAGIEQYESYFEAHGFGAIARRIQEPIRQHNLEAAAALVPDEMVRAFVACGTDDEIREYLERAWHIADSLCIVPPVYALPLDAVYAYQERIAVFATRE